VEEKASGKVHVYHEGDDDPEKCTALRLAQEDEAVLHETYDALPRSTALSPYADTALSPADSLPVVIFDSSWESAEDAAAPYDGVVRALPFVVAANPVSYGRAFRLNTAEAVVAALYIVGEEEGARRIASYFDYGETFLEMNREPLERYAACGASEEVVEVQGDYLGSAEASSE
jgi:pre-rRNA-processing protein TSR3